MQPSNGLEYVWHLQNDAFAASPLIQLLSIILSSTEPMFGPLQLGSLLLDDLLEARLMLLWQLLLVGTACGFAGGFVAAE